MQQLRAKEIGKQRVYVVEERCFQLRDEHNTGKEKCIDCGHASTCTECS